MRLQEGQLPNFCMHCGLQILHDCPPSNHHHLSFIPYCPSCGLAMLGRLGILPFSSAFLSP